MMLRTVAIVGACIAGLASSLAAALPRPETHVYKRVGDLEIKADVYRVTGRDGPHPVMVYMHGGSLINGRRESVEEWTPAHALHAAGVAIVSIDYRLAPETKLPQLVEDVEDAFRWVRAEGPALFGADPARVGSSGGSAGGYLALVTGHRVKPAPSVILAEMSYCDLLGDWQMRPSIHPPHYEDSNLGEEEAWKQVSGPPIANARDRNGDGSAFNDFIRRNARWPKTISGWDPVTEADKYTPFLPLRNVTSAFPPTIMIHGEVDTDVPFSQPQAMAAEFARHDVPHRLIGIPNGEHGYRGADQDDVDAARREAVAFALVRLMPQARVDAMPPVEAYTFKRVGNLEIKADVNRARGEGRLTPVVVWIHGGGLMGGERQRDSIDERQLIDLLLAGGITVVSIDYRLAPETKLPAIIEDVEDAFRWVRERGPELFGADPERIGVVGTSAGGYLSLTAGFRVEPRPRAIVSYWGYGGLIDPWYSSPSAQPRHNTIKVSESEARRHVSGPPVANAGERAGSSAAFYQFCRQRGLWPKEVSGWDPHAEPEKFDPFMPIRNVTSEYPATLLIHGEADTDVPCSESTNMAAELRRHGVEHKLIVVPGAEHGLKGVDPSVIEALDREAAAFFRKHLFADGVRVSVDGSELPLNWETLTQPASPDSRTAAWARTTASGPVPVSVAISNSDLRGVYLTSVGADLPVSVSNRSIRSTLPGPGQYRLSLKTDARPSLDLVLFIDHPTAPTDASWIDVTSRGVATDGTTDSTAQLQTLLDEVAFSTGGGLHFPTGVYRAGPLRIGSRTTIHLATGATLKAIDDPAAFDRHFLLIDGAEDVRLSGAGTIDGNGTALLRSKPAFIHQLHGLVIRDSKRVRVEGIVLRDCCDWNMHILRSADVSVDRVRLFARKDGFAVDSSRDVRIADCFALSTDDTVLVCTSDALHPAERVGVSGGMFGSSSVALKIGSLTASPIRDVTFEGCEVFDSSRAFAIETRHPVARVERAVWRNIRAGVMPDREGEGGDLISIRAVEGGGEFFLTDCAIENVAASTQAGVRMLGTGVVAGLSMRNVRLVSTAD